MKKRAEDFKNYAHDLLYENDESYRNLIDKRNKLLENEIEASSDEITIQDIVDILSADEAEYNEAAKNLEASSEIEGVKREGPEEAGRIEGEEKFPEIKPETKLSDEDELKVKNYVLSQINKGGPVVIDADVLKGNDLDPANA